MGGRGPVGGPDMEASAAGDFLERIVICGGGGGLAYITVGVLPAPTSTSVPSEQWMPAKKF